MHTTRLIFVILFFRSFLFFGQAESTAQKNIDVQKYVFHIAVNDTTDVIHVRAEITVLFNEPVKSFSFDLVSKGADGKGMRVDEVLENKVGKEFKQTDEKLIVNTEIKTSFLQNTYTIKYPHSLSFSPF